MILGTGGVDEGILGGEWVGRGNVDAGKRGGNCCLGGARRWMGSESREVEDQKDQAILASVVGQAELRVSGRLVWRQ